MHGTEWVLWALLLAATAFVVISTFVGVPYPIVLVIGGAFIGFVPGIPDLQLDPDVVFLVLLPPIIYSAAFFSSVRGLRANVRPISLLAIGCVLVTMCAVALIAHEIVDLPWAVAFTLGAIVAPTDAIAATAIGRDVGAPRRLIWILEGESLMNDAVALIAYGFAIDAVATGSFSAPDAVGTFFVNAIAGVAIGLAIAWLIARVRRDVNAPATESVISLTTAYLAYLPAAALGVSAVLAAVAAGLYLGWRSPELVTPQTRLELFGMWSVVQFTVNAAVFLLLGLQLPSVLDALGNESAQTLIGYGAAVSLTVILVRFAWVFPATYVPRFLFRSIRERDPYPPVGAPTVISWSGMRGAVSLAAALALPLGFGGGDTRDLLVFLTYTTILVTLILQGLTLPALIRALGLGDEATYEAKESKARLRAAEAAIERLDELLVEEWVREDTADRMRRAYEFRRRRFTARFAEDGSESDEIEGRSADYQRLQREMLEAQRRAIIALRNDGLIDDETMHRVERDLDLEDTRLEI